MKRVLSFFIGIALLSLMASCGSTNESASSPESEQSEELDENSTLSEPELTESKSYDVEVYSDRRLSITLSEISSDQIIFSVSNTSDASFTLSLDFALDGQVIPGYNSAFQLKPGETSDFVWQCTISNTDHKYLSMYGIVFIDNSSVDFSVCDFDIGGEDHEEYDYESGTVLYSSDGLTVEFLEPDSTGLNIKIVNYYDEKISPFFDSLYINGDESINYNGKTCSVPPHSTYIFHINTLDKNNEYFASDVEYILGSVKFQTRDGGYTDEFGFDSRSSLTVREETEEGNSTSDKKEVDDISLSDEGNVETAESEEATEEKTDKSDAFVAQGSTSLMNFLSAALENGYSIERPSRNSSTVSAEAVGPDKTYNIKYTAEDQHVYGFNVYADSESELSSDGFINCIIGLSKALNSDLEDDAIKSYVEESLANPDTQIIHDETLYIYQSLKKEIAVSY